MLNLKSDPGLNYLLKFQDFICAIRRERHLQPLRIQGWMEGCLWQGYLPLNQLTAVPAIICPRWPHFVSYLASYKYLHEVTSEWMGGKSYQELCRVILQCPGLGPPASCGIAEVTGAAEGMRQTSSRWEQWLWLSLKPDQVALQRSSASQAPDRIWFGVCISPWLPKATPNIFSKILTGTIMTLQAFGLNLEVVWLQIKHKQIFWFPATHREIITEFSIQGTFFHL